MCTCYRSQVVMHLYILLVSYLFLVEAYSLSIERCAHYSHMI